MPGKVTGCGGITMAVVAELCLACMLMSDWVWIVSCRLWVVAAAAGAGRYVGQPGVLP